MSKNEDDSSIRDPRAIRRTQYLTKSRDEKRRKENAEGVLDEKQRGSRIRS